MNEEALNERLYEIDMSACADRIAALREGRRSGLMQRTKWNELNLVIAHSATAHFAELLSAVSRTMGRKDVKQSSNKLS